MKTWKRILTLTLSAIIVAGLAACGGGGNASSSAGNSSAAGGGTSASANASGDAGDPVTLVFSIAAVPTDAKKR